jgi:hypothetical protein
LIGELDVNHHQPLVALLVVIAVLFALIVGLIVGFMAKLSGDTAVIALRQAGVAFMSTVTLVLVIMTALGVL